MIHLCPICNREFGFTIACSGIYLENGNYQITEILGCRCNSVWRVITEYKDREEVSQITEPIEVEGSGALINEELCDDCHSPVEPILQTMEPISDASYYLHNSYQCGCGCEWTVRRKYETIQTHTKISYTSRYNK